jgi:hypothetical protein
MHRLAIALVVIVAASGCNRPVKLQFAAPPPERVTARGPLAIPAVQALNAEGAVVPDVKIDLKAEPAGVVLAGPEGLSVANRGDVTLTWSTDKGLLLSHPLRVLLPTRVELRCLPSCFGTIGGESKLETLVYSEADLLGDLKAPCTTDNPGVAKVEGEVLKFIGKGDDAELQARGRRRHQEDRRCRARARRARARRGDAAIAHALTDVVARRRPVRRSPPCASESSPRAATPPA